MRRAAVFLDKDGTLVEDVPYNVDPSRIRLTRGAGEAVRSLAAEGYRIVVISNQSGVARGFFAEAALTDVERHLRTLLAAEGVELDGFYYCPHHPQGKVAEYAIACDCRKPQPGMVRRAASDLALELQSSWFVGDILDDVEAGRRAGCQTVLLDTGHETEWIVTPLRRPSAVARDLPEAADIIRSHTRRRDWRRFDDTLVQRETT